MGSRDEILRRLRGQRRAAELPRPWRSRRAFDSLAEQFAVALAAAGGEVRRAAGLEEALAELGAVIAAIGAQSAVADADPLLLEAGLPGRFPDVEWRFAGQATGEAWRADCAAADLGVSVAAAALAETGSVAVHSGPGRSRLTGLLPPVHAVLVPEGVLTADLFTWTASCGRDWPAALTFISGPSKTADIEQTMATGVHGPGRFVAVLYAASGRGRAD
jgi:L-lactate utilization protein LutC